MFTEAKVSACFPFYNGVNKTIVFLVQIGNGLTVIYISKVNSCLLLLQVTVFFQSLSVSRYRVWYTDRKYKVYSKLTCLVNIPRQLSQDYQDLWSCFGIISPYILIIKIRGSTMRLICLKYQSKRCKWKSRCTWKSSFVSAQDMR